MVGGRKKAKICDQVSHEEEDRISHLPDPLICEILYHLSTKDAVRTSVLSTRWRYLWQSVPGLDLGSTSFLKFDAFVSFVERYFISHRESWIRKLRLSFYSHGMCDLASWIDAVTRRKIQHLEVDYNAYDNHKIPLSLYTCETLVHLRLCKVTLPNAEFVNLPCLKIIHLRNIKYPNETTLQKLISGSPVLEDFTSIRYSKVDAGHVLQLRSHTLKRIDIYNEFTQVVIDAPRLQCLRASVSSPKSFQIVNLGSSAKLEISFPSRDVTYSSNTIHNVLTDISRVRELVITNGIWKYSKPGPVLQFHDLSRLNVKFSKSDLEMLPTILENCPKLESLVMELVQDGFMFLRPKKTTEPKVMFSTVPMCLVSSLKVVEWKRSITGYEEETELVRYFLKNSKIMEKLKLDVYYTEKAKCAFLQELLTMPRCSTVVKLVDFRRDILSFEPQANIED
ncbi:PREDICTED: F-box/FBD/LRR-repeat protein At1g51370-like [Camelina sativa]|uniref:F-box/FBD/LRR-repeat protein At1g51370-like n=1 Tax=Camelina sativa TaxID=90675 RepID=A0ABM1QI04_CAMSA|nr:PREDICTED: F-box/FBD/LRR-repeat protein At1g51370-like [Camelina sativa]